MEYKHYHKIHRLGKEEVEGILKGICMIQEKIDGANTSIWMQDGKICCGSRNNILSLDVDSHEEENTFNGFVKYVREHEGIRRLLQDNPEFRLYGEWLVKHTVSYKPTSYKHFYLFDIEKDEKFMEATGVSMLAAKYEIHFPQLFETLNNPTMEELNTWVGQSNLGEKGEGIVIKNLGFVNKFGKLAYAKVVTNDFKESNAIAFGGNNKHSDSYWEVYIMNKYMTVARVQKIMNKIQPEITERLDMQHIPRITNMAYHDLLTEEIWEIARKAEGVNFKVLQRLCMLKSKQLYADLLLNDISVADIK